MRLTDTPTEAASRIFYRIVNERRSERGMTLQKNKRDRLVRVALPLFEERGYSLAEAITEFDRIADDPECDPNDLHLHTFVKRYLPGPEVAVV